jgi:hypothetical protein
MQGLSQPGKREGLPNKPTAPAKPDPARDWSLAAARWESALPVWLERILLYSTVFGRTNSSRNLFRQRQLKPGALQSNAR